MSFSFQLPSDSKLTKIGRKMIGEKIHKIIVNFKNVLELICFQLGSPSRTQRSQA